MLYSESLKKNRDFQKVYRLGKSYANRFLIMYALQNDAFVAGTRNRLGISVSKKVGNSVVRHHLTRLVRESYRLNEAKFKRGYDFVVIVRPTAKEKGYREIEDALLHMAKLQKVLNTEKSDIS
ncbi:MAG: ribonuclease P protein component [Eubacteriales bacterium]|nr:ribonuclease P protein component [Eubacteriales bacterium]